uniref:Uncharacterized protein n=1 Tax=Kalanchoe fedtschenkoi TaxID=63787 RepID=A0A7N1A5R1_KALFE
MKVMMRWNARPGKKTQLKKQRKRKPLQNLKTITWSPPLLRTSSFFFFFFFFFFFHSKTKPPISINPTTDSNLLPSNYARFLEGGD